MEQEFAIDWLQMNTDLPLIPLPGYFAFPCKEARGMTSEKAHNGYTIAWRNKLGALVQWNAERADMGVMVSYSGKVLTNYMVAGCNSLHIFRWHMQKGDKCSRIDLAIDCYDTGMDIPAMYDELKQKRAKTTVGTINLIDNIDGGCTLYVGSRQSEKMIRIYDKAREMEQSGDYKRVELEVKGKLAYSLANAMSAMTIEQIVARTKQIINHMVCFDSDLWRWVMGDETCNLTVSQKKQDNFVGWLQEQVAPGIANYVIKTGERNVIDHLAEMVNRIIEQKSKQ